MKLPLLGLLLAAAPAFAQYNPYASANNGNEEGIGLNAGQNSFYSIINRQDATSIIQITKLSLSGQQQWRIFYNPGYDVFATTGATDRNANVYVVGTARGQGFVRNVLVVKYAPNGGLFWNQVYPSQTNAVPTVAAADADGNLYIGATVSQQGGSDLQVFKYGPNGNLLWTQPYREGRTNYAQSITLDADGNAFLMVQMTLGDASSGSYRTRQVKFWSNGGITPL